MPTIFDKKGISITAGFDFQSNAPLDSRLVVDTYENLEKYLDETTGCAYLGMQVFCEAKNTVYVLKGTASDRASWRWEVPSAQILALEVIETEIEEE